MAIHTITLQLSDWEMRTLIYWSKIHGRTKATYGGQIIGSRLEANAASIKEMMSDIAKHEGISIEELEARWLSEEKFSTEE